jgi:hypothetical protein
MTLDIAVPYPPSARGRIVVWGLLAAYPFGGMTWQVLHYVSALRRMGFDVWYVEDSDRYVYDPETYSLTSDCTANVRYMARYMEALGLQDRWVYRPVGSVDAITQAAGFCGLRSLYSSADAALNLCGAQEIRDEHRLSQRLVYVQTDPVRDQVLAARCDTDRVTQLNAHDYHFTYGENLGAPECPVPHGGYAWLPTRPPACVDWWRNGVVPSPQSAMTTIANWTHSGKDVEWRDQLWSWRKDAEFLRFSGIAARSPCPMELAVGRMPHQDAAHMRDCGWRMTPSVAVADPDEYRLYIQRSRGEFTVAKPQYVLPRTGWFSDRSVCYLAAGRPVVTQDTAFGKFIPTGRGLFAFSNEDDAVGAIQEIVGNYEFHSRAAREIAATYFGAERVLGELMQRVGLV